MTAADLAHTIAALCFGASLLGVGFGVRELRARLTEAREDALAAMLRCTSVKADGLQQAAEMTRAASNAEGLSLEAKVALLQLHRSLLYAQMATRRDALRVVNTQPVEQVLRV